MANVRRMTVSELIRETKPDWKPVHKQEKRASTRPFSGSPQVSMGDPTSFERQLECFEHQNQGGRKVGRSLIQPSLDEADMIEGFVDAEIIPVDDE